jgi:nicotinamidase-related amidase
VARPKTLFEMAGVEPAMAPLETVAVVLIDMQMEYVDGKLALPDAARALTEAARLVKWARSAGRPVIHIQQKGRAGGLFDPAGSGFALAPEVAPTAGEPVLVKGLPNSFAGTELEAEIRDRKVQQVIFAGFMTHMCVSSTVRAALDRGIGAAVLASACATRDLADPQGAVIPAATLHRAELAALADRFALIVPDVDGLPKIHPQQGA